MLNSTPATMMMVLMTVMIMRRMMRIMTKSLHDDGGKEFEDKLV